MTSADALSRFRAAGLHVRKDGDLLRVGPASLLTPEVRAFVLANKANLLDALDEPDRLAAIDLANDALSEPFADGPVEMREWAVLELPDWLGGGYSAMPADAFREIAAHNALARENAARKDAQRYGAAAPERPARPPGAHQTAFLTDRPAEAL